MSNQELQCYNISCGKTYLEEENNLDACQYHPGKPYFHDGYKEWTCCKMRSRDFSVFMGFKGCTKGRHSNVKPEVPSKPEPIVTNSESKNDSEPVKQFTPPDPDLKEDIQIFESASLAKSGPPPKAMIICQNCKQEESTLDMNSPCLYHKGVQIFHDAYKFWSCCQHKKFSDFDDFQKLPPCAKADKHVLIAKVEYKENWFQTGGQVTIALYGLKGARLMDGQSRIVLHGGKSLHAKLINSDGLIIFEKEWILYGFADGSQSKATINPSNVQIVLKKADERVNWEDLTEIKPKIKN